MNSYTLSRQWFAFAFENPSKVKPIHGSIYFWLIELANRLGWPAEFGNPGSQCMAACGISSYNTYKKAFDELAGFGFVEVKRKSTNQYSSCIIALSVFDTSPYKALDKSLATHCTKHLQSTSESTIQSTGSINKPLNQEPTTSKPENVLPASPAAPTENQNPELPFELEPLEPKKPKEKSSAKKEKVPRPWADQISFEGKDTPELRAKWQEWIDYKFNPANKKSPYTTLRGEQAQLDEIGRFATPFALWAIDNAIDKEWQGIVNDSTRREYERYGKNPAAFMESKGRTTLSITKSAPEKGTPEYYEQLKKQYAFSKTA